MIRTCSGCGATWLDGQLYWATGKMACPHDLAGLVCNDVKYPHCINPCLGSTSGMTWSKREMFMDELEGIDMFDDGSGI
tara:strand:+ start:664 stop:900 length:237 start_codon:yes stop_codon:yes gene_type:complete